MKKRYIILSLLITFSPILFVMPLILERCNTKPTVSSIRIPHYGPKDKPNSQFCVHPEGIDLSHHNEAYDWNKVDAKFVYVRASQGCNIKDQRYEIHKNAAIRHNIPLGVYHFLTFVTPAKVQFDFFKSIVRRKDFTLRPMLDVEEESFKQLPKGFNDNKAQEVIYKWCLLCKKEYGCFPIIYTTESLYIRLGLNNIKFKDCLWWVANYNNIKNFQTKCKMPYILHQYSDKQYVEGFYGHIDCNRFGEGKTIDDLKL